MRSTPSGTSSRASSTDCATSQPPSAQSVAEIRTKSGSREGQTSRTPLTTSTVLYRPPVKRSTWLLWGGPFLLLLAALTGLALSIRRRRRLAGVPLQDEQAERARRLLGEDKV